MSVGAGVVTPLTHSSCSQRFFIHATVACVCGGSSNHLLHILVNLNITCVSLGVCVCVSGGVCDQLKLYVSTLSPTTYVYMQPLCTFDSHSTETFSGKPGSSVAFVWLKSKSVPT